ncbi:MAG TPA: hypothetical protein VF772_17550 [Terriglobales bacterium]
MAEKWMQSVSSGIEKRGTKGVFKAAAQRAGMSTRAYAEKHKHSAGKTGRRARLALAFMSAKHGG